MTSRHRLRTTVAICALMVAVVSTSASVRAEGSVESVDRLATAVAPAPAQRQTPPLRSAVIISDSAMAGVRWNGALGGFRGFAADARLESCRRLVTSSCRGREGYRPRTALSEVNSLPAAGSRDVLVIAVGYNDWHANFESDARTVLAAARAKGFTTVAWVTYRELVGYTLPTSGARSDYAFMNARLRAIRDSGDFPELKLWDLDAYTRGVVGWFAYDGVHETRRGSWGVADWISRHVAALDGRPCVMPWSPTFAQDQVCPDPDALPPLRGHPDLSGLYGI
ncbi:MAG: SGNH/GDSL hydrolase family protein [Ilumatobacter sp.]|uniref:SGNH/GDSL hydrolase family protein n=1 Tax=Ilumatobacter sp. TaxID=1967498 RepID=UPI003297A1C3